MIGRRGLAVAGCAVVLGLPRRAAAQKPGHSYRLGWLSPGAGRSEAYNLAFVQRLRDLGFVEGRNLVIEFRSAEGRVDKLPELAAELARARCDLFLAPGAESTLVAIERATRDVPILMVANDYDPVATGHVAGLARPGGRITGLYQLQDELSAKRLELLKEMFPKGRRVAVLADTATRGQLVVVRAAARKLGVELLVHEFAGGPYDFDAAFAGFARAKADGLLPLASGLFVPARRKIPELALAHGLAGVYNNALWVEAGGLVSYGVNFPAAYRRAAEQAAMILNGTPTADMPVEQSTVFELAVNLKTAKALGIAIPQLILFRADRVVE